MVLLIQGDPLLEIDVDKSIGPVEPKILLKEISSNRGIKKRFHGYFYRQIKNC
jgi:hypothetical protein